jgi:hypothetical protein
MKTISPEERLLGKTYKLFEKGNFTKDKILIKAFSGIQNDLPEVKELFSTLEKLIESFRQTSEQLRALRASKPASPSAGGAAESSPR